MQRPAQEDPPALLIPRRLPCEQGVQPGARSGVGAVCATPQPASIRQMSGQVSRGSAGEYQADERAGIARTSWRLSVRSAGRCRGAQLASIRLMSGQLSWGSAREYQADEQAGVARLSWRVSGR